MKMKTKLPKYGVFPLNANGRMYDPDDSRHLAENQKLNAFSGILECEEDLWRTAGGFYFATWYRPFDGAKAINPLRRREAKNWLNDRGFITLSKDLFPNLPFYISADEVDVEFRLSVSEPSATDKNRQARLVWWATFEPGPRSTAALYFAEPDAWFHTTLSSSWLEPVHPEFVKHWLIRAEVPELANMATSLTNLTSTNDPCEPKPA